MTKQQTPCIEIHRDDVALVLTPDGGAIFWGTAPVDGENLSRHAGLMIAIAARLQHDPTFSSECVRWFLDRYGSRSENMPAIFVPDTVQ